MTRHTTIIAGRGARKRAVRVERKRREAVATGAARDPLRLLGTVIVADALGLADEALGGVMTGERLRGLLAGRAKVPIADAQKCQQVSNLVPAESTGIAGHLPTGLLIAELCAGLDHVNGRFPRALWLGGVL